MSISVGIFDQLSKFVIVHGLNYGNIKEIFIACERDLTFKGGFFFLPGNHKHCDI